MILASKSPRRREILDKIHIPYLIYGVNVEENIKQRRYVKSSVLDISKRKTNAAVMNFSQGLVVGVDTIVCFHRYALGKPKTAEQAYRYMKMLSGNKHHVISGITVKDAKSAKSYSSYSITEVHFVKMTEEEVSFYVERNEWIDKAGGYAIQGMAALFIERIVGSYYNVMGLPVEELYKLLKRFDFFEKNNRYRPVKREWAAS